MRPTAPAACVFLLAVPLADADRAAADRIAADVARLAADAWQGRRAGSAGADQAADWIASEFRRISLAPAGDGGGYGQEFSFIDGVVLGPGNRLAVGGQAFKAGEDFRPLAFSSAGSAAGEVVFASYGIVAKDQGRDDYAGLDVKDRVVLVLRFGPGGDDPQSQWAAFTALRLKASNARERGAKALLVVTGPGTPDAKDELVPLRADASLTDAGLLAFSVRQAVAEALLKDSGTALAEAQQQADAGAAAASFTLKARLELTADVSPKRSKTRNVLGLLRGRSPQTIVVGAHYDHLGLGQSGSLDQAPDGKVHHGADDNASGSAGLLELARRLRAGAPWEKTLLFAAFGAEEQGTLGSSYWVKHPTLALGEVAAMVNMDMIGRLREDTLAVQGVGTSPAWKPLVEEANRSVGLKLSLHEGGYGPSDHNTFYAAGKPVLFVFTGAHADYHRPSDTADKIDAAGIDRVLDLVQPVVAGLARSSETVAFTRVAAEQQPSPSRGFRVWVGGIPDYSEEGIGVRFSGVTPGSPAEKAGLQGGDVLVRFGEKEIRNIYDYTFALSERKPGEKVKAVVKRGGEEVMLEITLGSRPSAGH